MYPKRQRRYLTGEQMDALEEREDEIYDEILNRLEAEFIAEYVAEIGERPSKLPSFEGQAIKELEKMKHDAQD